MIGRHRQCPANWEGEPCIKPMGIDHHEKLAQPRTRLGLPVPVHQTRAGIRWAAGSLMTRAGAQAPDTSAANP